jgi:hypothetical protein
MKNTILLMAATLIGFSSCKKEISSLPEPTQTGANTFGAVVNGENWGPLGAGILPTTDILKATFTPDSSVIIYARNFSREPIETEMQIYLHRVLEPGVYPLNKTTDVYPNGSASYAYFLKRNITIEDEWMTGPESTGEVTVTRIDWVNWIVSGTFSFTAKARHNSAPKEVTGGRFDVKIQ